MTNLYLSILFLLMSMVAHADEDSDIIKADREVLAEAQAQASTSKILAAKEQLSDDEVMQEEARRKDIEGSSILLSPDGQGHLLAKVKINNSVPASLVVDTGSPAVLLTSGFVSKLGLDISHSTTGVVEVLNGRYKAAAVTLDKIKIGDIEVHDVPAIVLLQNPPEMVDGLLGMSFLSKFHFTVDHDGQKLILKKLE